MMTSSIVRLYREGVPASRILAWAQVMIGAEAALEQMALALDLDAQQLARAREFSARRGVGDDSFGIAPPPLATPPDGRWNEEGTVSTIAAYELTGASGEQVFSRPNHLTLRWWQVERKNDQRWIVMVEREGRALPIDEHVTDVTVGNVSTYTRERSIQGVIAVSSPYPIAEVTDAMWRLDGTEWVLKLDHKNTTSYVYNTAVWWSVTWELRVGLTCRVNVRTHTDVST